MLDWYVEVQKWLIFYSDMFKYNSLQFAYISALRFVSNGQIDNKPLGQGMAQRREGTEWWLANSLTHICVTRSHCIDEAYDYCVQSRQL